MSKTDIRLFLHIYISLIFSTKDGDPAGLISPEELIFRWLKRNEVRDLDHVFNLNM